MITLTLDNRWVRIAGARRSVIRALEQITSYRVAGFQFSPAFRAKRWDGREHLLKYSAKLGYHAPSGLIVDIARELKRRGLRFRVDDQREVRGERRKLAWNPAIVLRDYQREAIAALFRPPIPGCGILKMPIRSGKTKTAARVIRRIGRPTLFIVPSQMLLYQTKAALEESFPGETIGMIGDSEFNQHFITVATVQTLARLRGSRGRGGKRGRKMDPRYKALVRAFDVVIFDEAHHVRGGGEWHKVFGDFDARYKLGLSATVFLDDRKEAEAGIIWLKATCGGIRADIPVSRLVEAGHLMRQNVHVYRVTKPNLRGHRWSATLRARCIDGNRRRNRLIALLARRHAVERGMKTLIVARHLAHIAAICDELDAVGVDYRTVTGADSAEAREDKVDGLVSGEFHVLIGTVMREGVDVPAVECVINAEGGADTKDAIQRQRNLTTAKGKDRALFIDFMDETNEYFEKHSKARLETYRSEQSFVVRLK